jgi:DNA-binding transcriptional LysR family regulator
MTLSQLEYFYQAAKTQHFNKAADNLSISQPSLSRAISSLENELGIVLFERVGRNVALTKAGQIFLEHTEKILDDIAIAERKMHQLACSGGEISIAYVSPLSTRFIPQAVKAFVSKEGNEGITFNFYQDISSQNIVGLKNGKYDIIFGAKDVNEISIRFIPLMKQEMVIITSLEHPLADQGDLSIRELANYPVIGYDRISGLGGYTNRLYKNVGIKPEIVCECSDENSIQALVREQFGIALVARVDILNEKYLKIHHVSDADLVHYVNVVWLKNHYLMPATKRFIDFMISGLEEIERIITKLRQIEGIIDIQRKTG